MLFNKNKEATLSNELFSAPTSEYRSTPFWAWNCKLEREELLRQIDVFKEMGFGGYHIHVRTGLETKYLSDEFMSLVSSCVEKSKQENMLTWLYDEDRWPSGFAGGLVTKDKRFRSRYLLFTNTPYSGQQPQASDDSSARGGRTESGRLIAAFDVELTDDGYLKSYKRIDKDASCIGQKWYAYLEITAETPRFNLQTYVNTLDKKAIERFVEVTHERYKEVVGKDFGTVIPAIFTDEPQFTRKSTLENSLSPEDVVLPWTDDLEDTYKETYGESITDKIPELIWEMHSISKVRYNYHDHIAERFSSAYADTIGEWCRKNNIMLTGHMMEEDTLTSQTAALGEAMRSYRGFDLPGIDMLCAAFEFNTAKQAQSACHQFGNEGVLSELYGVTSWAFDFRGYKLHGDWQAALGVSVRVPHLSWVSMQGEAKRDYPASISYQSPWYKQYNCLEDHFARVNTAMTRGKPIVKVGVIHPVESYWIHFGPNDKTSLLREQLDDNFRNLTDWLLKGCMDFDFISESLLPIQCSCSGNPLKVGKMEYDAIIVPACETLRSTTLERLESFKAHGGKLIFMGKAPEYENAVKSSRGKNLAEKSVLIPFERAAVLSVLEENREVSVRLDNGKFTKNLIHSIRQDGENKWLFISHACEPVNKDLNTHDNILISVKGEYSPEIYDTLSGSITEAPHEYKNGNTVVSYTLYSYDSLLIKFVPGKTNKTAVKSDDAQYRQIQVPHSVPFTLSEENVLLLDMAEFRFDNEEWNSEEEILILDNIGRRKFGWHERQRAIMQPWISEKHKNEHKISLRFTINSDIQTDDIMLAMENAECADIKLNSKKIPVEICGWFTDKCINKFPLGKLEKGINTLEITLPYGPDTNIEWCYLLGDFGVSVLGRTKKIIKMPDTLAFSDITSQGLPFYGANITYHFNIETQGNSLLITSQRYRGALIAVKIDGNEYGKIIYPPYNLKINGISKGKHALDITLYTNRANCFGPLHLSDSKEKWHGPDAWRSEDDCWSYEYNLMQNGLLTEPKIEETV